MKYLQSIYEIVYVGKIGLKDYRFYQYDTEVGIGFLDIIDKEGDSIKFEIKGRGNKENDKWDEFTVMNQRGVDNDTFEKIVNNIVYILNKNKLGYKWKVDEIVYPKYGLLPYGIISVNNEINLFELEKLFSSTKQIRKYVKPKGGFDQWTF